jgi:hypothetical protein
MEKSKLNNTTAGLAGLLNGIYTGVQNNRSNSIAQAQLANQTQETAWKNPYRPISELDIAKEQADPIKQAIAQLISTSPMRQQADQPLAQPLVQGAVQGTQQMTANNTAPVAVQKFDWLSATPEDFSGWQNEMKKRQASRGL